MKKWISSLAAVVLMATIILSGNNEDLIYLIIPEADACSCSHVLNTGSRIINVTSTIHTINATVYPESPGNSGNMEFTYSGPGASNFVIDNINHTTSASAVFTGLTVQISNIPPTGSTSVFQIQGHFTATGTQTLFVIGSNLMNVTTGSVDGGNCNSLSGSYTVTAANELPLITPNDFPDVSHNDTPGQIISPKSTVFCDEPDATDVITDLNVVGNVANVDAPVGINSQNASIDFNILNPDPLGGPSLSVFTAVCTSSAPATGQPVEHMYIVEFTNSLLTVTPSFTLCQPGDFPITGDLKTATCTAAGTVTFTDLDDAAYPITTSTSAPPAGVTITTPLPPIVLPGVYPVVFSIAETEGGSVRFEGTNHSLSYGEQQIGQNEGEKTWKLLPEYDKEVKHPPDVGDPEVIIRKKICYEVAIGSDGEEIGRRETGSGSADDEETFSLLEDIPRDNYEKAAGDIIRSIHGF